MAIITQTKMWGNSIAIIIPKKIAQAIKISPRDEVEVSIKKRNNALKLVFGVTKFSKSVEQLLKENRKGLSKWE